LKVKIGIHLPIKRVYKTQTISEAGQPDFGNLLNKLTWLVVSTHLKNMKVSWDDDIPNIWENKKCSKPPTSHDQFLFPWVP
jgi:hypothetical protein